MNDQQVLEIATILHHQWSVAMQTFNKAKAEKDDGLPDWKEFHTIRVEAAERDVKQLEELKAAFQADHPINMKALGF